LKVSEVEEWGEREGGRGKEGREEHVIIQSAYYIVRSSGGVVSPARLWSLPRETKGGGKVFSTLL